MQENFKSVKSVFHVILLGLQIILAGLILNFRCIACMDEVNIAFQFVNSTVGGFLLFLLVIFVGIFFSEEFERKTQLAVSFLGAILHFLSLLSFFADFSVHDAGGRIIAASVFCAVIGILYLIEAVVLSCKKKNTGE